MIRFDSTYKSLSHLGKHYLIQPLLPHNMAILNILSFSTLLVFAKAAYIDIGPCPPMPAVVSPFDVERVNMALLIGKLVKFTFCFSSTHVIGTLSGQHQSPTYLKGTNVPALSMDPSSREPTT